MKSLLNINDIQMRRQGIHFKEVFFARRVRDSVDGNYFTYNVKKKICNPKDEVRYYLKIGGIEKS